MSPRQLIAHYRVVSKLGEGGMGAVYRATDTKLNRDVAIKVLPSAFAEDVDRMQRFEREAQVLASLNHPNIASIYGIEQGAIVMELVEGEELKGPVPVETAIAYARQLVAALEAAHEKGIVHRDLKPANIKITPEGVLKVLDFGLAKAAEGAPTATAGGATNSPTLSLAMTQAGMILGTAAYMSPEQARGKPVDKRTDIWAFGAIVYYLLTGQELFAGGETVTDIIAAVVTREPDLNSVPERLRPLLAACLEKDPRNRLRDIGDWRRLLPDAASAAPAAIVRPARLHWAVAAVCALAAIGLGTFALVGRRSVPAPLAPLLRFEAEAPVRDQLVLALSPDGSRILWSVPDASGGTQLALRSLDQAVSTPIPGTENATEAVFSPDGEWVAFASGQKVSKVRLRGGVPIPLVVGVDARGMDWGDDDGIVFAPGIRKTILRVPAGGGAPKEITRFDGSRHEVTHRYPHLLPGGKTVIYTASYRGGGYDDADVTATEIASGRTTVLHHGGYHAFYVPGREGQGFLLYFQQGILYAMGMNPVSLAVREPPVPVLQDVMSTSTAGDAHIAISRSGLAVYQPGSASAVVAPVWFDAKGKAQPLKLAAGVYTTPRISPDGKKLFYMQHLGANVDGWVYDLASGNASKLTFSGKIMGGFWGPDSRHILVVSDNAVGRSWLRADGSAPPRNLVNIGTRMYAFSPDGQHSAGSLTPTQPFVLTWENLASDDPRPGSPEPWPDSPGIKQGFSYSADGKWLAYYSDETGINQIYVTSAARPNVKWQISLNGGGFPEFSPRGGELFYQSAAGLIAVSYTVEGDAFVRGQERVVPLEHRISRIMGVKNYSVAADGKQIAALIDTANEGTARAKLTFLVNFPDELERHCAPAASAH